MTRFAHDQFAKDILDETLSYIGGVNPAKPVLFSWERTAKETLKAYKSLLT